MVVLRAAVVGALACALGAVACHEVEPDAFSGGPSSADGGVFVPAADAGPPWAPWPSQSDCLDAIGDQVVRDADGDGVDGVWLVGCGGEKQTGTTRSNFDDCDDTNPAVSRKGFRDADGDGVTTAEMGCFAALPDGYRTLRTTTNDCDDTSAALQSIAYADADGDGYGAPGTERCAPDTARAPGLSSNDADCDDGNPAISPLGLEQWDDGVDSNCDGHDSPLVCNGADGECGCQLLATTSVPVDPACASVDLFVVAYRTCLGCFGYNAVIVGNRGTVAVTGGFDIGAPSNQPAFHVAEDLAPGAVSHPFIVRGDAPSIVVTTPAPECDVQNDQAVLPSPGGTCVL